MHRCVPGFLQPRCIFACLHPSCAVPEDARSSIRSRCSYEQPTMPYPTYAFAHRWRKTDERDSAGHFWFSLRVQDSLHSGWRECDASSQLHCVQRAPFHFGSPARKPPVTHPRNKTESARRTPCHHGRDAQAQASLSTCTDFSMQTSQQQGNPASEIGAALPRRRATRPSPTRPKDRKGPTRAVPYLRLRGGQPVHPLANVCRDIGPRREALT